MMREFIAAVWAAWSLWQIIQVFRKNPTPVRVGFVLGAALSSTTAYLLIT